MSAFNISRLGIKRQNRLAKLNGRINKYKLIRISFINVIIAIKVICDETILSRRNI